MARTSNSRGKGGFKMRSGNNASMSNISGATPYPFLGKIGKGIGKLAKASPIGQVVKALTKDDNEPGSAAAEAMGGGDAQGKLEAIQAILGEQDAMGGKLPKGEGGIAGIIGGEGTALTKKSPYHKNIDDKEIKRLSEESKIPVADINALIKQMSDTGGGGTEDDFTYNDVKKALMDKFEGNSDFAQEGGSPMKHTGGTHEDHHEETKEPKQVSEGEIREKDLASFDVQRELDYINRQMQHGNNAKNPYYTDRKAQLEAYLSGEGTLDGYQRATP
jgi:hypothetical protein